MIEGEGYFKVQTNEGARYTRSGDITLSSDGALVTKSGDPILGDKGVIFLRDGEFKINRAGEVYQGDQLIDKIQLFKFDDKDLIERTGQNYLYYTGAESGVLRVENPAIRQGLLEGSNVNAMKNMTAMIIAHRAYEAYQKAVKNYDSMMEKSSNSVGAVRT